MNKFISCHRKLESGYWKNDETGLTRHFKFPPTRGKWTRMTFDQINFPSDGIMFYWI